jgi:hypothetical protein
MGQNGKNRPPRPAGVQEIFDELARHEFADLAEAQAFLDRRMAQYNAAPQAELGALSPDQMARLLYGDWEGGGALRLASGVTLEELAGVEILVNARRFLAPSRAKRQLPP